MQIEQDNPVRFVDAFMEHLDISQLGFVVSALKTEGRTAFELKLFLKIYLNDILTESVVIVDWKKYAFVIWNCICFTICFNRIDTPSLIFRRRTRWR